MKRRYRTCKGWAIRNMSYDRVNGMINQLYDRSSLTLVALWLTQSTKGQEEQKKTLNTQLAELNKSIDTIEEKHFVKDEMKKEPFDKFYVRYKEQEDNILRELKKFEGSISNPRK